MREEWRWTSVTFRARRRMPACARVALILGGVAIGASAFAATWWALGGFVGDTPSSRAPAGNGLHGEPVSPSEGAVNSGKKPP